MPNTLYRGSLLFYFGKVLLGGLAALFLALATIGIVGGSVSLFKQLILREVRIDGSITFVLLFLCLFWAFAGWFFLIGMHMYPEIGTSPEAFWYRYWFRWKAIPWEQISNVETAKMSFSIKIGLLVYADCLPFYHRFYGKAYGSGKGKALLVANRLKGYERLEADIRQYKFICS
jgi:hypothetical protein